MNHNAQLNVYGGCRCTCHQGYADECDCGWIQVVGWPVKTRIRSKSLLSRVKAFTKAGRHPAIAVTKAHYVHSPKPHPRPLERRQTYMDI